VKRKKIIASIIVLFILSLTIFCNPSFSASLDIHSEAAILIDSKTGAILYSKNANEKMYPASTTKILTAILAIESFSLEEKLTASHNAVMSIPAGYSNAAIQVGEALTVKELLEVFLIHSANEVGFILAESISGSVSEFSVLMNEKALELGCKNTHFTNPSGLHDTNHYSTAYDLAQIAKYCMKNETFRTIVAMPSCTIEATDKYEERHFKSTNEMLNPKSQYYNENVIGIKTGYTSQAKNCLIAGFSKNNMELISVVLGAPTQVGTKGLSGKFTDTQTLFDYSMKNYTYKNIASSGQIVTQIEIENATSDTKKLDLVLENNIETIVNNSINIENIKPEIKLNDNITAPISVNDILGTATYTINDVEYTTNILARNSVKTNTYFDDILKLSLVGILLIVVYELIHPKKHKKKKHKKTQKSDGKYLYGRVKY